MKEETTIEYWYLRPGDFRPERLTIKGAIAIFGESATLAHAIELLEQSNNLFPSRELATEASRIVRSFLAVYAIERTEPARLGPQTQTLSGSNVQPAVSIGIQIFETGTRHLPDEPR